LPNSSIKEIFNKIIEINSQLETIGYHPSLLNDRFVSFTLPVMPTEMETSH